MLLAPGTTPTGVGRIFLCGINNAYDYQLIYSRKSWEARMMWSYVKLDDETQFAYSGLNEDGTVVVAVERPVDMGFDSAECLLPAYRWVSSEGFSEAELDQLMEFVKANAPLIFELAERHSIKDAAA